MIELNISLCYVADPHDHRMRRSAMTGSEFKRHVSERAIFISALGNNMHPSSFEYLRSYVNDTTSHIHFRCSAIRGIGRYDHLEVIWRALVIKLSLKFKS